MLFLIFLLYAQLCDAINKTNIEKICLAKNKNKCPENYKFKNIDFRYSLNITTNTNLYIGDSTNDHIIEINPIQNQIGNQLNPRISKIESFSSNILFNFTTKTTTLFNELKIKDISISTNSLSLFNLSKLSLEGDIQINNIVFNVNELIVDDVEIVSLGLMLTDPNDAVVWRGPKKNNMINQFFEMIDWHCSTVIVDLPPGTSDEHLTTFDVLKKKKLDYKVVIVTTPNILAIADVKKGIKLCQQEGANIIGVIENFCGVLCPCCGKISPFIGDKSDVVMNEEFHLPILVKIPFLPEAAHSNDKGEKCDKLMSYFDEIVTKIEE